MGGGAIKNQPKEHQRRISRQSIPIKDLYRISFPSGNKKGTRNGIKFFVYILKPSIASEIIGP